MFQFRPVKQFLSSPELGDYCSYGIHAFATTPSGCADAGLVSDVSCDLDFVSLLAGKCTSLQLDPVHLLDVVLDALP